MCGAVDLVLWKYTDQKKKKSEEKWSGPDLLTGAWLVNLLT